MEFKISAIKKYIIDNLVYIIFFLYLIIFSSLAVFFNKLSGMDGLAFLLFQIGAILLPGTAIVTLFFKNKPVSSLELLIFAYVSGYIFNIIVYFLLVPLQIQKACLPLWLILDCISIYIIRKYPVKKYRTSIADWSVWGGFIACLLLIVFVIYCGDNLLPTAVKENAYYTDLLYWIGDTVELAHNFPPNHFRNTAQPYYYHYFSSIQMAVMNITTKINVAELSLVFAPFQSIVLMVSSAFLIFKQVVKSKAVFYTVLGMTILFLTAGNEADTAVNYVSHMYKAPFGFDISMAFGMFALLFLLKQFSEAKLNKYYYLMTCLSYFVCLGTKGPIGAIVLGILGIICLYHFFIKKQYKLSLPFGITLLAIFFILICFVLVSNNTSVASTLTASDAVGRLANRGISGDFFEELYYNGVPWVIARALQVFYFAFQCQYAIAIIFFIGLVLKLINYKKIDCLDIACITMSFIGCVLTLIMGHPTFSQVYFVMAAYPYALLFGIKSISDFNLPLFKEKPSIRKSIFALQIVTVCFAVIIGVQSFFTCYYFRLGWDIGIGNLNYNSSAVLKVSKTPLYNYVSYDDYEAYVWIRENTKWDDIFTSNLCLASDIVRPYCLGAFSERHILMNDTSLIKRLMNNDKNALDRLKNNDKVVYIVQYKEVSPEFDAEGLGLECVFENDSISVFKVG